MPEATPATRSSMRESAARDMGMKMKARPKPLSTNGTNRFLQNVPSTGSCVYRVGEGQERGSDHHHGLHARARDGGLRDRCAGDRHPRRGQEGEPASSGE